MESHRHPAPPDRNFPRRIYEVASVNRARIIISLLLVFLLALMMVACGCSSSKTSSKPDASSTKQGANAKSQSGTGGDSGAAATSKPVPVVTKPKPTPALNQVSFSLSLKPPQEYNECTQPIYLKSQNILHLAWSVTGVGEYLFLTFNTPNGKYIGVKADGTMAELPAGKAADKLSRVGSFILKPAAQNLGDGYYIFRTYISDKDEAITVKLLYWIEE